MTTLAYKPRGRPTQLLKDLIDSYWDTRGGNIPKPVIIEKPPPNYQRADLRNQGDHVLVALDGHKTEYVSLAFQHVAITADLTVQFNVFTSRQRFYDYVDEVRRIIMAKQHYPTDYLLDGFESYANTAAVQAVWGDTTTNSTISLLTSARKYGTNSMRVVVGAGGAGGAGAFGAGAGGRAGGKGGTAKKGGTKDESLHRILGRDIINELKDLKK